VALPNATELDDYTYRVAGCVGEFWTKICRAHLFRSESVSDAELLHDGVSFGKGLQLVNILRDVANDLRIGRCYLPADALARRGLRPVDLLNPASEERLRPLYDELLEQAEADLGAGWDYTNALPRGEWRLRLACAWPVLFGVKTIARLRRENPLDPDRRVKISRSDVKQVMVRSVMRLPFRVSWERMFAEAQQG
jgi:farnesyl-diphosphate farnesyltransferase